MQAALKKKAADKMEGQLEHLRHEMAAIRTGRASLGLLDHVKVDYYGTPTPLKQVATLAVPESRLITVQPFDPQIIKDIEKAILASDLGLTPANDGKLIRLPIPPLTEERRRDLTKVVRKRVEEDKIAIRNIRRDALEQLRAMEKAKEVSEDDARKGQERLQVLTDTHVRQADQLGAQKEADLLEV